MSNPIKENNDYVERMLGYKVRFSKLLLKNFRYYLKLVGTNVTVRRTPSNQFRDALGAAYIFDGLDAGNHREEVYPNKRIVINRTPMTINYRTTTQDLIALCNEDFYRVGDQIEFNSRGIFFKYKVIQIEQYDPYDDVLYQLTLGGFDEHKISE